MENFNQIYESNYKRVLNHISARVSSTVDAEELTQDVFIKVYDNLHTFDSEQAQLITWIYNIAKNAVIDHWRSINKQRQLKTTSISAVVDDEGREFFEASIGNTALTDLVDNEYRDALKKCVLDLPKTYRRMANLRYLNGMSYDEIAERMQLSLGTVKGKLSRAKSLIGESIVEHNLIKI